MLFFHYDPYFGGTSFHIGIDMFAPRLASSSVSVTKDSIYFRKTGLLYVREDFVGQRSTRWGKVRTAPQVDWLSVDWEKGTARWLLQ